MEIGVFGSTGDGMGVLSDMVKNDACFDDCPGVSCGPKFPLLRCVLSVISSVPASLIHVKPLCETR